MQLTNQNQLLIPAQESGVNIPQESQSPSLVEFCNINDPSIANSLIQLSQLQGPNVRTFSLESDQNNVKHGPESMSFGQTNFASYMKLKNLKFNDQGVIFYQDSKLNIKHRNKDNHNITASMQSLLSLNASLDFNHQTLQVN